MPAGSTIGRRLPIGRDRFADYSRWNSEVGRLLDKALESIADVQAAVITEVWGPDEPVGVVIETTAEDAEKLSMLAFQRANE